MPIYYWTLRSLQGTLSFHVKPPRFRYAILKAAITLALHWNQFTKVHRATFLENACLWPALREILCTFLSCFIISINQIRCPSYNILFLNNRGHISFLNSQAYCSGSWSTNLILSEILVWNGKKVCRNQKVQRILKTLIILVVLWTIQTVDYIIKWWLFPSTFSYSAYSASKIILSVVWCFRMFSVARYLEIFTLNFKMLTGAHPISLKRTRRVNDIISNFNRLFDFGFKLRLMAFLGQSKTKEILHMG